MADYKWGDFPAEFPPLYPRSEDAPAMELAPPEDVGEPPTMELEETRTGFRVTFEPFILKTNNAQHVSGALGATWLAIQLADGYKLVWRRTIHLPVPVKSGTMEAQSGSRVASITVQKAKPDARPPAVSIIAGSDEYEAAQVSR